jgi:hypothetical protein
VDRSTLLATLLGGALAILGGIVATLLLAWLDATRERRRLRERHATAVRIVVFELRGNCTVLVTLAYTGVVNAMSSAAYNSVASDLYSLLPAELASDLAFAYGLSGHVGDSPQGAKLVVETITPILNALRAYGERELGLTFAIDSKVHAAASADKPA